MNMGGPKYTPKLFSLFTLVICFLLLNLYQISADSEKLMHNPKIQNEIAQRRLKFQNSLKHFMEAHKRLFPIKEEEPGDLSIDTISESGSSKSAEVSGKEQLLAIIADEDTCVGYILAGIGQVDEYECPNFYVVTGITLDMDIAMALSDFCRRKDIGIILIQKEAAERVHHIIHRYRKQLPVIMEIPGKNGPYDISIDHILEIAQSHEKEKDDKIVEARRSIQEKRSSTAWDSKSIVSGHSTGNHL